MKIGEQFRNCDEGGINEFCGNRGGICIIDLGGMDTPALIKTDRLN